MLRDHLTLMEKSVYCLIWSNRFLFQKKTCLVKRDTVTDPNGHHVPVSVIGTSSILKRKSGDIQIIHTMAGSGGRLRFKGSGLRMSTPKPGRLAAGYWFHCTGPWFSLIFTQYPWPRLRLRSFAIGTSDLSACSTLQSPPSHPQTKDHLVPQELLRASPVPRSLSPRSRPDSSPRRG
jgi:hypothetical protein